MRILLELCCKSSRKQQTTECEITHKLDEPWGGFVNNNDFDCGREKHLLLELFEYIMREPVRADRLLVKLSSKPPAKRNIIERVKL